MLKSIKMKFIFTIVLIVFVASGCSKGKDKDIEMLNNLANSINNDENTNTSSNSNLPTQIPALPTAVPTATPTPEVKTGEYPTEEIQKILLNYYNAFFVDKDFGKVYDMFYDKSLAIDNKKKEEFITEKQNYFKNNNVSLTFLNFDSYNFYNQGLTTFNLTLTIKNGDKEEKVTESIHLIKVENDWKIVYKGQLSINDFPATDTSDKTKFYMYVSKYIVGVNYVSFLVNVENNTSNQYVLGYKEKPSEMIVITDVGTYRVDMQGTLESKTKSSNWITVYGVQGNINDIGITRVMLSDKGIPKDDEYENPKDYVMFKVNK